MDRKGLIGGGKCAPWCAIKAKLDALYDRTHNAFSKINGVEGDGTGNLQIEAGTGISLQQSGNRIQINTEEAEPYTGITPIVVDDESKEIQIDIDGTPAIGSEHAITSGGVYAALSQEATARAGADSALSADLAAETAARTAADTAESSARIAADNALGDRIDKVIDGTTPPTTISGVLPIANGGTGSATQNFVDINTNNQNIASSKIFNKTAQQIYINNPAFTIDQTPSTATDIHAISLRNSGIYSGRIATRKYTDGSQRLILESYQTQNASYNLSIRYSSNSVSMVLSKTINGVTTETLISSLRCDIK